ncbi:carboxymuconolactone decarboxylase family protein [Mycobacteroides abscessus]|uniref:Carboxymuconolactone decarboxylase family protein n=1 Tax=Mycobacteroides abscessus TaxID=36809 RepID=A0ABD7HFM0_9MYCO|nr:carboxymuconolactone decarboxylase family protein [Mycobacteroides abscessus]RIT26307.1 carboxymuconolactone decarboxylase family protein [Mycobacteroides abscessus]
MARIPLADPATLSGLEQAVYQRFPANLVLGLLRATPEIADGYLDLGGALSASPLNRGIREMVILRVGTLSGSAYERMQHLGIARSVGLSDAEIAAVDSGRFDELAPNERAILRFVDELVASPKATVTFDAALRALGEQGLATVILLVGHYMLTARLLETLEIDLDAGPTSWDGI